MDYTVESANRLAAELRAIPPKDPAQRRLDKQGMVRLLAEEIIACSSAATRSKRSPRACVGAASTSRRPRSRTISNERRAKPRSVRRASFARRSLQTLRWCARGTEARHGGPLSCGGSERDARAEAADRRARSAAGAEAGPLRSGKGAFLVKDKDSY